MSDILAITHAAETYREEHGQAPSSLADLVDDSGTSYLNRSTIPLDPWGRVYRYHTGFVVYSLGRDGAAGGSGEDADLTSLQLAELRQTR